MKYKEKSVILVKKKTEEMTERIQEKEKQMDEEYSRDIGKYKKKEPAKKTYDDDFPPLN